MSEVGKFVAYNSIFTYYFIINRCNSYFANNQINKNILSNLIIIYNISISILSWIIFLVTLYENVNYLDFYSLTCENRYNSMINIFYILKYIEWFDTIFLVAKNKKISFLHYFHHMIVPLFTYINSAFENTAGQTYVMISNSFAHGLMYMYYAYPKKMKGYSKIITFVQTAQHLFALVILINQLINYHNNECKFHKEVILVSITNYFIFFFEFFKILIK